MKILRGKTKVRFVAMTLAFATVVSVAVKENMFKSKAEVVTDGVTTEVQEALIAGEKVTVDDYEMECKTEQGNRCIYFRTSDEDKYSKMVLDEVNEVVEVTDANNNTVVYDFSEESIANNVSEVNDILMKKVSYGGTKKTCAELGQQYWYKKGNEGKQVYYRIGCKSKYQIKVNKSNKKTCEKYANAILSCNEKMDVAYACLAGFDISAIIACILASLAIPVSALLVAIAGILGTAITGSIATGVKSLISAVHKYQEVKDLYIDARACGVKY